MTLSSAFSGGSNRQKQYLMNEHIFEAICDPLQHFQTIMEKEEKFRFMDVMIAFLDSAILYGNDDYEGSRELVSSLLVEFKIVGLLNQLATSSIPYLASKSSQYFQLVDSIQMIIFERITKNLVN